MSTTRKPTVRQLGPRDHGPHGITVKLRESALARRFDTFAARFRRPDGSKIGVFDQPAPVVQARNPEKDRSLHGKARVRARKAAQRATRGAVS